MPSRFLGLLRDSYARSTTQEYVEGLHSSWVLPTSLFCALRALISLYAFVGLFFSIGWRCTQYTCEEAGQSFSYFTVLGYWGLAFYYAVAAAHTGSYAIRGRPWLSSWPVWMRRLHSVFYASITVFPFIVTIVYWALLSDGSYSTPFSLWRNVSEHGLNSLFALLEIILPRSEPHPWVNLLPLIFLLVCYLGLAYLTRATQGFYVYDFLDPANGAGAVAGYCLGILAAGIVIFVIVRYMIWLRQWLRGHRRQGSQDKYAGASRGTDSDDLEMASRDTLR